MSVLRCLLCGLLLAVLLSTAAYADPPEVTELSDLDPVYIAVSATGAMHVWMEDTVTYFGVPGETEFTINVSECHPEDVDTCWFYFDGEDCTGTSVDLSADSYREHYGCVIVRFTDETFDYAGFSVCPSWETEDFEHVETLATTAPTASLSQGLPSEVDSVFTDVASIDPDGPTAVGNKKVCDSGHCIYKPAPVQQCTSDAQCNNP